MAAKIIAFPVKTNVDLTESDRDVILLAADEMIHKRRGKELLVQVLKGMRSELVLESQGEKLRCFAMLAACTLGEIDAKIERMLEEDLLRVEWYGGRALLAHSPLGWERVKPLAASAIFSALTRRASNGDTSGIYAEVGRYHREVKNLVLARIDRESAQRLAPLLRVWAEREESKAVRRRIQEVLQRLSACESPSSSPR